MFYVFSLALRRSGAAEKEYQKPQRTQRNTAQKTQRLIEMQEPRSHGAQEVAQRIFVFLGGVIGGCPFETEVG